MAKKTTPYQKAFRKGFRVEWKEHGKSLGDRYLVNKIVMDHLREDIHYYDREEEFNRRYSK